MLRKEFLIGLLAAALSFGLAGTAFAADADMVGANDVSTEAGRWQHNFDNSNSMTSQMADRKNYNQDALSAIGTEAGNWQFRFDSPDTKAAKAARNYDYDPDSLSAIGTEAGSFDSALEDQMRLRCSDC
ncbi:MAG: hypothetical protein ACSLFH_17590 [Desulfuromonadales bacterium]